MTFLAFSLFRKTFSTEASLKEEYNHNIISNTEKPIGE